MGVERQPAISAGTYISIHQRSTAEGSVFDNNALCDSRFERNEASGSFGGAEEIDGIIGSIPYIIDRIFTKKPTLFLQSLIFPLSWATVDYLTQFTPYGSWGHAAYSQYSQLVLLQSISIFGMAFITFLIGWFASTVNWAISLDLHWRKIKKGVAAFGAVIIFAMAWGSFRLVFLKPEGKTVRIASISAMIKEDQRMTPELQTRLFSNKLTNQDIKFLTTRSEAVNLDLLNRSEQEAKAGAKIIFWGEANASTFKEDETKLFNLAREVAKTQGIYLGLGLATLNRASQKPLENKLVLINPDGEIVMDYWKAIPVPGGEALISAVKGKEIPVIDTNYGKIATAICFDMDFPQHLKQAKNADILIAPSNDWKAIDPWHTHMARFRAIENGFNLIRHTSNGLSAGIDFTGKIISEMDHYTDETRILITNLPTKGVVTIYSVIGDSFPLVGILFLIFVILYSRKRMRSG